MDESSNEAPRKGERKGIQTRGRVLGKEKDKSITVHTLDHSVPRCESAFPCSHLGLVFFSNSLM